MFWRLDQQYIASYGLPDPPLNPPEVEEIPLEDIEERIQARYEELLDALEAMTGHELSRLQAAILRRIVRSLPEAPPDEVLEDTEVQNLAEQELREERDAGRW